MLMSNEHCPSTSGKLDIVWNLIPKNKTDFVSLLYAKEFKDDSRNAWDVHTVGGQACNISSIADFLGHAKLVS